jgi:hypothetical protein
MSGPQGPAGSSGGTGDVFNPVSRYTVHSTANETVMVTTSAEVKTGLTWSMVSTNLTITDNGHGHSVGEMALIRNTNVGFQAALITAVTTNTFTVTASGTGATSGTAGGYSMGVTFAHNAAAGSITGGTMSVPGSGYVTLMSMRMHLGANTRSGTTYALTLSGTAQNGAGDNTGVDNMYVPLVGVRQDTSTLAAVGATLAVNQASAGYNVYQFGALPASTIGIVMQLQF